MTLFDMTPRRDAAGDGRPPRSLYDYPNVPSLAPADIARLVVSDDPMDIVLAHAAMDSVVRLPKLFVVIEAEDSPNLRRVVEHAKTPHYRVRYHSWSVHELEEDAIAWAAMFQQKSDAEVDRHPWWGPDSRRKFEVAHAAGASHSQLRVRGAEPKTAVFQ